MSAAANFPPNPFTPGTGHPPPYFAGRGDVLEDLLSLAGQLDGPAKPRGQVLVAPRGYGKTVLLRKFSNAAKDKYPKVRHIHTRASKVKSIPDLIAVMASETGTLMSVDSFGINIFGSGGSVSTSQTVSPGVAVETALDKGPTILVLDEAGELRGDSGHILLNAVESLMEQGRRIMVVIGGTPKIYAAFKSSGVTFRERFDMTELPLLDEPSSGEVISRPLLANDMRATPGTIEHIVQDSKGYPFFLQTWGRRVYDAAVRQETHTVDEGLVRLVRADVRKEQERLYEGRQMELRRDRDIMAAAVRVAKSFSNDGGDSRTYGEIDDMIVESLATAGKPPDKADSIIRRLHEVGFIWQITRDTADNWEAGIPSLMGYTLSKHGDRFGRKPQGIGPLDRRQRPPTPRTAADPQPGTRSRRSARATGTRVG